jgi:hypothetical protein
MGTNVLIVVVIGLTSLFLLCLVVKWHLSIPDKKPKCIYLVSYYGTPKKTGIGSWLVGEAWFNNIQNPQKLGQDVYDSLVGTDDELMQNPSIIAISKVEIS